MRDAWPSRAPALLLVALLLGAAAAGCPESFSQLCPANTRQEGLYQTTLSAQANTPHECRQTLTPDGGALDASIADPHPPAFTAALCSSRDDAGTPQIWLALPRIVRSSPLGDGGTFVFGTDSVQQGTRCACDLTVSERIEGRLLPLQEDAGVELGDEGLPRLRGFAGTVTDLVDGGPDGCLCNLPCSLKYDLDAKSL